MSVGRTGQGRRSIRLEGYDYAGGGAYFVTICTHGRECRFGEVVDGELQLNDLGRIVEEEWLRTPTVRPNVLLDAYVVMPNHLHAVLIIDERLRHRAGVTATIDGVAARANSLSPSPADASSTRAISTPPLQSPHRTVGSIVRGFKAVTTHRSAELDGGLLRPLWQRNYYEHIIHDDEDMARIRHYITINPSRWNDDRNHPKRLPQRCRPL